MAGAPDLTPIADTRCRRGSASGRYNRVEPECTRHPFPRGLYWEPHGYPPGPYLIRHFDFHLNVMSAAADYDGAAQSYRLVFSCLAVGGTHWHGRPLSKLNVGDA